MPTYRIENLGCKANLYDAERLAEALQVLGYERAAAGQAADVCVLNSCTVTAGADRKSRQLAARLARENPDARVYVTGCYATAAPEELRDVAGVDAVFARDRWPALLRALEPDVGKPDVDLLSGDFGITSFREGRTRAFMKIQEGCDAFCSYCVLPRVRGEPRSRPLQEVAREAAQLAVAGFPEIVLTGIHLGFYGRGLPGEASLADAVLAVAEQDGVERVRISSLEPNEVDDRLLEALSHPKVCPHLHLPLQSGDAQVLRRMNRRYEPRDFLQVVSNVRDRLDRPAVTTDVMVGFPGETEQQFRNTLSLCRQAAFSRMHVFPYSPRPGTPAAAMDGQLAPEVTAERSKELRELGRRMSGRWAEGFLGGTVKVLWERRDAASMLHGYTERYVALSAPGGASSVGNVCKVRCTERRGGALVGRVLGC